MGIILERAAVEVYPDTDRFGPELDRKLRHVDASKSGDHVGRSFGAGFLGTFGKAAVGAGALLAGAGIAKAFSGIIEEAREAGQVTRITENAIRATGGAANVTAGQVGALSQAISNKTGIDDEQIQASANLLLTFKNVRNELGEGNAVFDRATALTQDLAAAGFGSAESASKMLGKALNDPIAGLTALGRAGVTFTEQQKEQIKTLVETGDVLGAQRIILDEVASQVGGAAAAAADPMQRLGVVIDNLKETLGTALMPVIEKVANFIMDRAIPAFEGLFNLLVRGDFTSAFRQAFNVEEDAPIVRFLLNLRQTVIDVFNEVKGGVTAFVAAFKDGSDQITSSGFAGFLERLGVAARNAFDYFKTDVLPRLQDFAGYIMTTVVPVIRDYLLSYLEGLRGWLNNVRDAVEENRPALEKLGAALVNIGKWIVETVIPALGWLAEHWFPILGHAIGGVIDVIAGIVEAVDTFIGWLETLANWINIVADYIRGFGDTMSEVWANVVSVVAQGTASVVDFFLGMAENILEGAARAFSWVPGVGPKLEGARVAFAQFRDGVNEALDQILPLKQVELRAVFGGDTASLVDLVKRGNITAATGGLIRGPGSGTSDSIPAWLSNGEYVMKAAAVEKYGPYAMAAINSGTATVAPGFAAGGGVNLTGTDAAIGVTKRKVVEFNEVMELAANGLRAGIRAISAQAGALGQAGGAGGMGYQWQMAVLRQAFPGLQLISGYRPGAITATGNASWHGKGRAVDIPPRMDVFNWIRSNYGAKTLELIFSPANNNQIYRGQPHYFSGVTRAMHFDHVHWAYDQGGWLMPGRTAAVNNTGQPERILAPHEEIRLHPEDITAIVEGIGGYYVNGRMSTVQRATMSRRG